MDVSLRRGEAHGQGFLRASDRRPRRYAVPRGLVDIAPRRRPQGRAAGNGPEGLAKAVPKANHRSSDVTLVILAGSVTPEAARAAKKRKRSKTYKFGFWGYSHFRLVVYDLSADTCVSNSMGASHKKATCNIVRGR